MTDQLPNDARVIDAAFRATLDQDWGRLQSLVDAYPHLLCHDKPREGWSFPWPVSLAASMRGVRAQVTWNFEGTAFTVWCADEQFARWIGYSAASEEGKGDMAIWYGTQQCRDGTWVAQFTVIE